MKQELVGVLLFKKKYTLAKKKKKKRLIVLALSAKNVLKLMPLMMITYLYHTYGVFFTIVNVNSTVMVRKIVNNLWHAF